jgi:hypothetical protein
MREIKLWIGHAEAESETLLRAFSASRYQRFVPGALPQAVTFRAFGALKTIVRGTLSQVC